MKSDSCVSLGSIAVHTYKFNHSIFEILDKVDFIVTQNIGPKFEGINTKNLLALYPKKIIKIHNLHFEGYHPDWCYLPTIDSVRLKSPVGDYHNLTILESFMKGESENTALQNYFSSRYNHERYGNIPMVSLSILKEREEQVDIQMTEYIEEAFNRGDILFNTFNHPKKELLSVQAERIITYVGLDYKNRNYEGEVLDNLILRTNPIFSGNHAIKDVRQLGKIVDMDKFVTRSYQVYRDNMEFISKFSKKHIS